jgi:hypothetical protein
MAGVVSSNYAHELRSPPVPLVALLGHPERHKLLSEAFLHTLKPPLVSLCCTEPVENFVPRVFSTGAADVRSQRSSPAA